jgi:acetyltransferase/esterase
MAVFLDTIKYDLQLTTTEFPWVLEVSVLTYNATEQRKDRMKAQTLQLKGATLYYETRGSGPVLLLIAGGAADAGGFEEVASFLAHDYTVVTYDPRGNSRSPLTGSPEDQQIEVHSDDARRLLETVTDGPAAVFGTSSGAIVGLDLITRHPTKVARLVAHEPPLLEVLPDAAKWHAFHDDVYETNRREGARSATQRWATGVGLDFAGPAPGIELPPHVVATMKRIDGNWDFFFAHELRPFTHYIPDLPRLSAHKDRIVLVGGHDSRELLSGQTAYRPAVLLAERFSTQVVDFPGDHVGYATQPAAFAARLREVLG